jgi:hypothetical protein
MTDLQLEPALVELAKVLTDIEILAVPAALHEVSASAGGDDPVQESGQARGQIDQRQAARLARIAADDVVDTVIGTWGLLAPELSAPAMVRLEWFAREGERGTVALPEASATARTHLEPEVVEGRAGTSTRAAGRSESTSSRVGGDCSPARAMCSSRRRCGA